MTLPTKHDLKRLFGNDHRMSLLIDYIISIIKMKHIEGGRLTELSSATVAVEFKAAFAAVPAGVGNLRVYRIAAVVPGKYRDKDVRFYFASTGWLTTTGFEIVIDTAESLSGVIVEYLFYENRTQA